MCIHLLYKTGKLKRNIASGIEHNTKYGTVSINSVNYYKALLNYYDLISVFCFILFLYKLILTMSTYYHDIHIFQ